MVPERFVRNDDPPDSQVAAFIGAGYFTGPAYSFPGAAELPRNKYLSDPALAELMNRPHSQLPERGSDTLRRFEALHAEMRQQMLTGTMDHARYKAFIEELPRLRESLFTMLLEGFRIGMACINLPTLVKSYSGRVIEAMAACVPSVSWRPPNRPECTRLFKDGHEVILFDTIGELTEKLRLLRGRPDLRASLVTAARENVLSRHTSQIRCEQYSRWIDEGVVPEF
jgi:glycosyltransferase involved in cell wall biosynthesis